MCVKNIQLYKKKKNWFVLITLYALLGHTWVQHI